MDVGRRGLAAGGHKAGATRLGFSLLLTFFEIEARFPQHAAEVPPAAVAYGAEQVNVPAQEFARYSWSSRSIEHHSAQIRAAFVFRKFTRGDKDKLSGWLAEEVCPIAFGDEALREAVLVRCRADRIEPAGRVGRSIGTARSAFEQRFCQRTVARLDEQATVRLLDLLDLLAPDPAGGPPGIGSGASRTSWSETRQPRDRVLVRLQAAAFLTGGAHTRGLQKTGLAMVLDWLEQFPGHSWQQ